MERQLLLMGIDPGTTLGYALLDLSGRIVKIDSSKQLGFDSLIRVATDCGTILAVGCDKKKTPEFAERFARKVGAKVLSPDEDMSIREKQAATRMFKVGNKHQLDALASALHVHQSLQPSLNRIKRFVERNNATKDERLLIERYFKEGASLRNTLDLLRTPETVQIPKKITKPNPPSIVKQREKEIKLLRRENSKLKNKLRKSQRRSDRLAKKTVIKSDTQLRELAANREKTIRSLLKEIVHKDEETLQLRSNVLRLNRFISKLSGHTLVKKLPNLGSESRHLWNVVTGDVLLVENPNEMSARAVEFLQSRVSIIIHRKPIHQKVQRELQFIFVPAEKLRIQEEEHFALVNKTELRKAVDGRMLLKNIVQEYRNSRQI